MSRFFAAVGRFAVRFRWIVVAAWIAAAVLAQHFFPSLASVANASDASFLPVSSPSMHAARLAAPFQGVDQTPVPVMIADGSVLNAADLGAIGRLEASLGRVDGVRQVSDLGVSRDGRAVQLLVLAAAIFGRAVFWPSHTARGTGRPGWWGRTAGRIVAHPAATLALGVVGFGLLATAAIGYTPGGFGGAPPAPAGSDSAAGNALLAAHFPAASGNPTSVLLRFGTPVWSDADVVARAERRLAAVPSFSGLTGPLDVNGVALAPGQLAALHARLGDPRALPAVPPAGGGVPAPLWAAYRAESQFISPVGRTVLYSAALAAGDPGSNAALGQVPAIRAAVAAVARDAGATDYGVSGEAPATYDISRVSDHDLLRIVPVAIVVIALLLALVMRSLVAPVYLIASVALSYLAAFGLSVLLFQDAVLPGTGGSGGLPYFVPFLMFLFLLALGEDYNILVMTRIREEAGRVPLRQAVSRALERTGSTVTSAGLVLAGTFGVFALVVGSQPGGGPYRAVLASLALGILMDAFLVRTLLVPSAVALLGRWNWWPSAHGSQAPEVSPGRRHSGTCAR